jgi:protein TonB
MIAYKTSGNWDDVTSHNRNEIVFEGRNKEYGAYVVRQRYNGTLLLALLIAASFGVLVAAVPMMMNYFFPHHVLPIAKTNDVVAVIKDYYHKERKVVIPKPVLPPHTLPPANIVRPPRIVADPIIETLPVNPTLTTTVVGTPTNPDPNSTLDVPTTGTGTTTVIEEPRIEPPMTIVQVMPTFKGDLQKYFNENTRFPEVESSLGVQGTVYLTFVVETDGSISDIKVMHGVAGGPGYDKEAIRLLESMPKWNPGIQNGHAVRVQFNLPVHFSFK